MTTTTTNGAGTTVPSDRRRPSGRAGTVRARRRWPGSRATIGGLLVAVAALGIFWAVQQADARRSRTYVVADADLAAGHVLRADDLAVRQGELSDDLLARTFRRPADLIGGVVTDSLAGGELIETVDVAPDDGLLRPRWELSIGVDAAQVVAATGDTVDVVAVVGTGEQATSEIVAAAVRVQDVVTDDAFGDRTTLVLGLESAEDVLAVSRATKAGEVFVVRADAGRP
jgi:hypothetical protein